MTVHPDADSRAATDAGPAAEVTGAGAGAAGDGTSTSGPRDRSWSWYLVRVSGLFLAVLVPLHFAVVVVRDDIGRTTIGTVTERFADSRWQAVEWITIVLALTHAFLALRTRLVQTPWRPAVRDGAVIAMGVAFVLLGGATTLSMFRLS